MVLDVGPQLDLDPPGLPVQIRELPDEVNASVAVRFRVLDVVIDLGQSILPFELGQLFEFAENLSQLLLTGEYRPAPANILHTPQCHPVKSPQLLCDRGRSLQPLRKNRVFVFLEGYLLQYAEGRVQRLFMAEPPVREDFDRL